MKNHGYKKVLCNVLRGLVDRINAKVFSYKLIISANHTNKNKNIVIFQMQSR